MGERLINAEERLRNSTLLTGNKIEIQLFVEFKAAEKVGIARQEKYLRILRWIGEHYLPTISFERLTKDDVVKIVSKKERGNLSEWTKYDYELFLKTFLAW
jgi:hypothetical protein